MAIRRRGNGWLVTVELGCDPITGKRRRAYFTTTTKREAGRKEARLRHEANTGLDVEPTKITLAQYLRRWLAAMRPNFTPSTCKRYEGLMRHQMIPHIGGMTLSKLRPLHIQQLYDHLHREGRVAGDGGLSAKTILQIHRVLSKALKQAVSWQLIPRNVCQSVEPPRARHRELRALSPEETRRLLEVAGAEDSVYGDAVTIGLHSGLRLGELLGMRWEDIDLENGRLAVRRVLHYVPGEGIICREPKTAKSRRTVLLGDVALDTLRRTRRRQLQARLSLGPAYRDHNFIFATAAGTPIFPGNLRRAFRRMVEKAGVDPLRFHDLRHTHASLLLARGVHPKVVSERLGHASIAITLDTYSHVLPSLQEEAVRDLDAWLAGRA